jgi:hypothetical protein
MFSLKSATLFKRMSFLRESVVALHQLRTLILSDKQRNKGSNQAATSCNLFGCIGTTKKYSLPAYSRMNIARVDCPLFLILR